MRRILLIATSLCLPGWGWAQAGPPFLTNDPGTPGDGHWEINLGYVPTAVPGSRSDQLPQLDVNFGLGERLQLTYELPYVIESDAGKSNRTGWSNSVVGIKWRFVDQGERGWNLSTFPQLELRASAAALAAGIAGPAPRLLLPVEVTHPIGPVDLNVEAGYFIPWHGSGEAILGCVVGKSVNPRLELDAEVFDDRLADASPTVVIDVGGRFRIRDRLIALFMAGRGITGAAATQPTFLGYFGLQILLGH